MAEQLDLRFDTDEKLAAVKQMLLAGVMMKYPMASYAVEFQGVILDCIAIERAPGDWVPMAMVLPNEAWAQAPQRSQDYPATKEHDE